MTRVAKVLLTVLGTLAVLGIAGYFLVKSTTRAWFERDLTARGEVAVASAESELARGWSAADATLPARLREVARHEGVMAAGACAPDGRVIAGSPDFPGDPTLCTGTEARRILVGGREALVTVFPVRADGAELGRVVLLQDLAFVTRREAETSQFVFVALMLVALVVSLATLLVVRASRRGFLKELSGLISGERAAPMHEFQPLLRDVQELAARIAADREADTAAWTAERLQQLVARHLGGDEVIVLANREPYIHHRAADGSIQVLQPASGLVTALEPVMRATSGVWVGHGSGSADRETADKRGRLEVPPDAPAYRLRRVWLSQEEEQGYYYGFANEGLWPLCHIAHARPEFRVSDWRHYQAVNEKFAAAVVEEAGAKDPVVLVEDYHFAMAPRAIRQRLPRATIVMFWHIPWPNAERFGICPWDVQVLEGMLGANILGFHTQQHCNNFLDAVDRYLEARIDRERNAVVQKGRATLVRPYPISIEWPSRWVAGTPPAAECRAQIRRELGLGDGGLVGVGVDRMDYTKGVEERLLAVERMLERFPSHRGRFTFAQIAAPSRTHIERYRQLGETVRNTAARINQRFGTETWKPIALLERHHEPAEIYRWYRAADLCYVSSLHDGMNLVAKEFVAARDDLRGVLVLSEFTGAARELAEALIVNPYDLEQASSALAAALAMPAQEQELRMRALRAIVSEYNVYRWAGRMLTDATRLRRREQVSGRLSLRAIAKESA